MGKAEALVSLGIRYKKDRSFAHLRDHQAHFVPGEGDLDARVFVMGSNPGRWEDQERRPFVNRSGGLLDRMLAEYAGVARQHCYVTLVVKYRNGDYGIPDHDDVMASRPYVGEELVTVGSPIVLLVGDTPFRMVFPDLKFPAHHGQPIPHKGRVYLPVCNPSAVFAQPAMLEQMRKAFAEVPGLLTSV